jgi:hypothetical protein
VYPASSLIILLDVLIAHVAQDAVGDALGDAMLFFGVSGDRLRNPTSIIAALVSLSISSKA